MSHIVVFSVTQEIHATPIHRFGKEQERVFKIKKKYYPDFVGNLMVKNKLC